MDASNLQFEAIGTSWKIDFHDVLSNSELSGLSRLIMSRIAEFDKAYSRFRPDSLVMEMAEKAGTYKLPSDAKPMLDLYEKLYAATGGLFTPLIGQVLSDAGYDAGYSLVEREMAQPPSWDEALEYDFPTLRIKKPVLIDFGGLGKGYLIDIVSEIIEESGVASYTVDAGGDMRHRNADGNLLRVGLEHPGDFSKVVGIAYLGNASLSGSSGNRRAWGRFHHIMNPETLESPRHLAATWATADAALVADAMATCLFFVPPDALKAFDFEYCILRADYSFDLSEKFQCEIFTEDKL